MAACEESEPYPESRDLLLTFHSQLTTVIYSDRAGHPLSNILPVPEVLYGRMVSHIGAGKMSVIHVCIVTLVFVSFTLPHHVTLIPSELAAESKQSCVPVLHHSSRGRSHVDEKHGQRRPELEARPPSRVRHSAGRTVPLSRPHSHQFVLHCLIHESVIKNK